MSKRVANSREKKARNGRVRYSRWTRARRDRLREQLDKVQTETKRLASLPAPGKFARMKNKVTRLFRRGIQ